MSSLQIRDLETQAAGDPRLRRQSAVESIAQRSPQKWPQSPEDLIRTDRER